MIVVAADRRYLYVPRSSWSDAAVAGDSEPQSDPEAIARRDADVESDAEPNARETAVADDSEPLSDAESRTRSYAGDSIHPDDDDMSDGDEDNSAAVAARHQQRAQPATLSHGDGRPTRAPSTLNSRFNVGNIGILFGNWGERGTVMNGWKKRVKQKTHDRQITKSPAQIIMLAEAREEIEWMLKQPAQQPDGLADPHSRASLLDKRPTYEHYVIRGEEAKTALLIAARKDSVDALVCLEYDVHVDTPYQERGVTKHARTRFLVCAVTMKQNVGFLGREIVMAVVHGHYMTMKMKWMNLWTAHWDQLAEKIRRYDIKFMGGDWNMSITEVCKQLRSRGICCDCCAWYPWVHSTLRNHGQPLGFDSCGIFYIGGSVQSVLLWQMKDMSTLTAVADTDAHDLMRDQLDEYDGLCAPGQHWQCYRSVKFVETDKDRNLAARLKDLMTPSTTQAELDALPLVNHGAGYLRCKQKKMDKREWLIHFIDDQGREEECMPNGAHMPLCIFTNSSRARSSEAEARRREQARLKGWEKLQRKNRAGYPRVPAVADDSESEHVTGSTRTKGKGRGRGGSTPRTAVAGPCDRDWQSPAREPQSQSASSGTQWGWQSQSWAREPQSQSAASSTQWDWQSQSRATEPQSQSASDWIVSPHDPLPPYWSSAPQYWTSGTNDGNPRWPIGKGW